MKKEQLIALDKSFKQLEELQDVYERIKKGNLSLYLNTTYSKIIDPILYDILQKYKNFVIEDLKKEIRKRETELESISIFQLNKLV